MLAVSPSPLMPMAQELVVGHQRAGRHRRHPAVQGVEAVAVLEEVRRRLARTADAAELHGRIGIHPDRLARLDQVAGDAVVSAPLAERRGEPLKRQRRQAEGVAVALDLTVASLAMVDHLSVGIAIRVGVGRVSIAP